MHGRVHSLESFGTVDGPGVRFVVFLQGCPMRCLYCHNPDTWAREGGQELSVDDILARYDKNRAFYKNGGITVTGGEPLWQAPFVAALFTAAKAKGIHTCLDTSGITFAPAHSAQRAQMDAVLAVTDLVMLDIKHIDDSAHKALTGHSNARILQFAQYISEQGIPLLVRHVIVQGFTDAPSEQYRLGRFLGTLKSLKAIDALPYHNMGEVKYRNLGMDYPLKGVPPLEKEQAVTARKWMLQGISDERKNLPAKF